jgi:hypothetical protein
VGFYGNSCEIAEIRAFQIALSADVLPLFSQREPVDNSVRSTNRGESLAK